MKDLWGYLVVLGIVCASIVVRFCTLPPSEVIAQPYIVTAYCPCEKCCGIWATKGVNSRGQRVTASGHVIKPGDRFVAAPRNIPFGTVLDIPGYGRVPVLDRGGAIRGDRLDVFFDDKDGVTGHQRALNWGVQELMVGEVK